MNQPVRKAMSEEYRKKVEGVTGGGAPRSEKERRWMQARLSWQKEEK